MQLARLVYASNHGGITPETLKQILQKSRASNKQAGITGLLLAGEEDFMQLLEGSRAAISQCFMRITRDVRHRDVRVLLASSIDSRSCTEWSMHCVEHAQINPEIIARYWTHGSFNPDELTDAEIESLCRDLSEAS